MSTTPLPAKAELTKGHKKVIFASSLGTVFEWYDFFLYGSLAAIIAKQFFSGVNETTGMIFALLAFAAGFFVRPFGAAFFGSLGDRIGRKYTFLVTILIMGISTFLVGVLPNYASIGVAAHDDHPDYEHLMARADAAMYQAKKRGRNQVVLASDDLPPAPERQAQRR